MSKFLEIFLNHQWVNHEIFLMILVEAQLIDNTLHIFKVSDLTSFDICLYHWNLHTSNNPSPPKVSSCSFVIYYSHLSRLRTLIPRRLMIILSLYTNLHFLGLYINGIILCTLFLVWLISLGKTILIFTHAVICISQVHSFPQLEGVSYSIVWIYHVHLGMDILGCFRFWLLQLKLLWTFRY